MYLHVPYTPLWLGAQGSCHAKQNTDYPHSGTYLPIFLFHDIHIRICAIENIGLNCTVYLGNPSYMCKLGCCVPGSFGMAAPSCYVLCCDVACLGPHFAVRYMPLLPRIPQPSYSIFFYLVAGYFEISFILFNRLKSSGHYVNHLL
jgi:hypothetical protein